HAHLVAASRLERARLLVALTVAQVEQAACDERRGPVRGDVAEANGDERLGAVGRERQLELGEAEQLQPLGERLAGEGERQAVLGALVDRQIPRDSPGAPESAVEPGGLSSDEVERVVEPREREPPLLAPRRR